MADEVIKVIDELCNQFGIAIDWSANNILPYLQELGNKIILWKTATTIIWILIGVSFIIAGVKIFIGLSNRLTAKSIQRKKDGWGSPDSKWNLITDREDAILVFSVILITIGVIALAINIFYLAKIIIIPDLIILQEIQSAMRSFPI